MKHYKRFFAFFITSCCLLYAVMFIGTGGAGLFTAKPVNISWLEKGSIILNAIVVNPSKDKQQKAMLKAYLPEEVIPEDIVDIGDLEVSYDIDKGLYYIYKEVSLEPGEVLKRQIELKDVWIVSEKELESIRERSEELSEGLEGTKYYDEGSSIQNVIEEYIKRIKTRQREEMDSLPEIHIAAYRENKKLLDKIREEMIPKLEKINIDNKPATQVPVDRVFVKASWWIILGVIAFLGLLSLILFFFWNSQASALRAAKEEEGKAEKESGD